ncbi:hypothetical protein [uncultured Clostridium sp.]|uniref:hypothetical protein n=1 Tax=uncultured Clostridium sp. TaxID=59620 RepID=UPI00261F208E|nr:hypothetical protein [uncultured Clostridium sp.]
MKNKVKNAIKDYEKNFFYGQGIVDSSEEWNYSVFKRDNTKYGKNNSTDYYNLAIVREDYIEEDVYKNIIDAILKETDLKLVEESFKFDYLYNQKKNISCEVIIIKFYKPSKVCYGI